MNVVTLNLRAMFGRAYPRLIGMNREPSWMLFDTILPLVSISAYVFVYHGFFAGATSPAEISRRDALVGFVILGGTMMAFWNNVLWSMASQFYWEKEHGNLQLYMMAPMSRMAVLGGMAIGGMVATSVRAFSTLILGILLFGVVLNFSNPGLILVIFAVTLVALYGLGMMFASLYLMWGREAYHLSSLMEEPISLISGFNYPSGALPKSISIAASLIPATLGLDALRQVMFAGKDLGPLSKLWLADPFTELLALVVLGVVFVTLARTSLAYFERLAKREGRLTERHR